MTPPQPTATEPSTKQLFGTWFSLGMQSFGGGGSTILLIHRAVVERYQWISEEAFTRNWAICQVCPGINLIAFTLLCGKQIAGVRGMVLCLLGLLLPSVTITILLTAAYAHVRNLKLVAQALGAIIPASVGLGLLSSFTMVRPPLQKKETDGSWQLYFNLALVIACGSAMLFTRAPVIVVLLTAGGLSGLLALVQARRTAP